MDLHAVLHQVAAALAGERLGDADQLIGLRRAGLDGGRRRGGRPGGRRAPRLGGGRSRAGSAGRAVAAAGPAATVPVSRAEGTVIIAMDVSNSMAATDVAPSRLDAAKQAAIRFAHAQPGSVNVGVVAFQNGGLTTHQPSADRAAAEAAINRLSVTGGTSLAGAILTSLSAITGRTVAPGRDGAVPDLGYWGSATIVLFSDGQDGGSPEATEAAAQAAQAAGVRVETVGIGTPAGGVVEVDGYQLHTALDEQTLTAIADTTGGAYHPASDAPELDDVASTIDLRLTTRKEDLPLAGAFIAGAVLLLAAGAVLTVLRTGRVV
ncbi:VWA domain-containing protein [Frankia nepalensis]|uniref:VWA domain-containing protein n=1 Tax=Frankia nepalensis TaxID=1836974 RepID=UPI00288A63CF|nr:VWA domain-containing protein [Frankia nepalensis]